MTSATSRVVWHGPKIIGLTKVETSRRLNRCAVALHSEIIRRISTSTRASGPSLPGFPPHADTGRLRQSIVLQPATPANLVARVGTNLIYGKYLELGTKHVAARPFLRKTLREMRGQLRLIFMERSA